MFASIHLGSVRGIPIGANWSVFLIAWLIAWGLAGQALPSQVPGLEPALYGTAGALAAAAFFVSLLVHELAHALVARREGHTVEGITLWLLGGVARIGGDARTPGAEARIAGVGPLASFVLAGALGLLVAGLGLLPTGDLVSLTQAAAGWLAVVNVILAVFNLLPGAPLDGGRIARAVLWRWRGDKLQATRWSTGLGQLLGYGLVAVGLVELVAGADVGGLWSIVLGIFLSSAAGLERRQTELTESLSDVRVGDVMTRDPARVPGTLTMDTFMAAALPESRSSTWLLSGAGGAVTGMLGVDRLRGIRGEARTTTRLQDVAVPIERVPRATRDEMVVDLLARLDESQPPRALVQEGDAILGLVTPEDVARAMQMGQLRGGRPGSAPGAAPSPAGTSTSDGPVRP
jgi:Zn-dependent protease